jgi:hypothetical protein
MGFFIFGKAHTGSLYGLLPSADIGQVGYFGDYKNRRCNHVGIWRATVRCLATLWLGVAGCQV